MENIERISVFCGSSSGEDEIFVKEAYKVGKLLADNGITVVYGGAKIGVMGSVADGALENEGEVIGVIPEFLETKEVSHDGLTDLIVVESMHQRKAIMYQLSDAIIVLPGGFGTMEEFFEMLTWAQLGMHQKPIGILNTKGFYDHLLTFFDEMQKQNFITNTHQKLFIVGKTMPTLLKRMGKYKAPKLKKWITEEEVI
ncbi:LOG family protein [Frigoriflavimonas asaccharolytica]|uniref:Cytokinin riboside 5'-monophosphate phosphoribohydrolase n=1 Tax=Frigoriflavimonas asaccharolytica TaxID=2735899 RepID=A0A8J8K8I3_9FLAO|nr:TIGR00730 family Rossman fold protein [Frigoriflavimonas asaccharolytica]NRS91982.1 hypothetical protein [Frigoriflavimonas asaccharolytica]